MVAGKKLMVLSLTFLLLVVLLPAALAVTDITSCGTTISSSGEYTLPSGGINCDGYSADGVIIDGENIILDCGDQEIKESTLLTYSAVRINSGGNNVQIRNCLLDGFAMGVYILEASNVLIENNEINSSDSRGVYVAPGSEGINISENLIKNSGSDGVSVKSSVVNVSDNQIIDSGTTGVHVTFSTAYNLSEIYVVNNFISGSGQDGIYFGFVNESSIISNVVNGSGDKGIEIRDSNDNLLIGNNLSGTHSYGLYLLQSDDNLISQMNFSSERINDLYVYNSNNNEFNDVVACNYRSTGGNGFRCSATTNADGTGNYFSAVTSCDDGWPVLGTHYSSCDDLVEISAVDGDLDASGSIDSDDVSKFREEVNDYYGGSYTGPADLNGDGELTFADMLLFVQYYVEAMNS